MMRKIILLMLLSLLHVFVFAGMASAHVTVFPKEATQGAYEKFTVRVPTEKDIPTVKVEVKFPEDVTISRFEPKVGWKYELTRDASGKIVGVIWTTTGEGLSKTEFGEFNMQGKVSDKATAIVWKAYQTYQDGSVVEWVGAEGADKPASVTKVNAKPANAATDSHGPADVPAPAPSVAEGEGSAVGQSSNVPLYVSIAALVLGLISLIVSLRKR